MGKDGRIHGLPVVTGCRVVRVQHRSQSSSGHVNRQGRPVDTVILLTSLHAEHPPGASLRGAGRRTQLGHHIREVLAIEKHDELLPPIAPKKAGVDLDQLAQVIPVDVVRIGPRAAVPPRTKHPLLHPPQGGGTIQLQDFGHGADGDPSTFTAAVNAELLSLALQGQAGAFGQVVLPSPGVICLNDQLPRPIAAERLELKQLVLRPLFVHGRSD